MKKITSIELVFENCDTVEIPIKYIGYFDISGIETEMKRMAVNAVSTIKMAKHIAIEFSLKANKLLTTFAENEPGEYIENCHALKRIHLLNDIAHIYIKGDDGEEMILTNWVKGEEYLNSAQKTKFSRRGNLYLVIDEDLDIDDVFPEEFIDSERHFEADDEEEALIMPMLPRSHIVVQQVKNDTGALLGVDIVFVSRFESVAKKMLQTLEEENTNKNVSYAMCTRELDRLYRGEESCEENSNSIGEISPKMAYTD